MYICTYVGRYVSFYQSSISVVTSKTEFVFKINSFILNTQFKCI